VIAGVGIEGEKFSARNRTAARWGKTTTLFCIWKRECADYADVSRAWERGIPADLPCVGSGGRSKSGALGRESLVSTERKTPGAGSAFRRRGGEGGRKDGGTNLISAWHQKEKIMEHRVDAVKTEAVGSCQEKKKKKKKKKKTRGRGKRGAHAGRVQPHPLVNLRKGEMLNMLTQSRGKKKRREKGCASSPEGKKKNG